MASKKSDSAAASVLTSSNLKVASLAQLSQTLFAPKVLTIDLNSPGATDRVYPVLEFRMRPLTEAEWQEAASVYRLAAGSPPAALPGAAGKQEFNEDDAEYVKRKARAVMLQRVFCIRKALVDIEFKGATLDEQCAEVETAMSPRLVDALWGAIHQTTADPIQVASFT